MLLRGEGECIARAMPSRVAEFVTARRLAHDAMEGVGVVGPVLRGARGEPIWPDGVVGSITHCPGLRAAAVCLARHWRGIGIDAEPERSLGREVARALVISDDELAEDASDLALLLCAKEAASKARTSVQGVVGDFRHIAVRFHAPGQFRASAPDGLVMDGRWRRAEGFVLTQVTVAA